LRPLLPAKGDLNKAIDETTCEEWLAERGVSA
jgi:hypothetical protein